MKRMGCTGIIILVFVFLCMMLFSACNQPSTTDIVIKNSAFEALPQKIIECINKHINTEEYPKLPLVETSTEIVEDTTVYTFDVSEHSSIIFTTDTVNGYTNRIEFFIPLNDPMYKSDILALYYYMGIASVSLNTKVDVNAFQSAIDFTKPWENNVQTYEDKLIRYELVTQDKAALFAITPIA